MSEIGETFDALREMQREKKEKNRESSTSILSEKGIKFENKNNGLHLIVDSKHGKIDYYPSTGKFIIRQSKKSGRGIFNLLKVMGIE